MAEFLDTATDPNAPPAKSPEDVQRKWIGEIERATRYFQNWVLKGEKIVKKYRKTESENNSKRKYAMLWANTQIMMPTVYAQVPEPIVERRFKDKDPAARLAGEMLERACDYILDKANFDDMMKACREDLLLPGRGTAWIRFQGDGNIALDSVHWRDYLHQPARQWSEVSWVAKRSYLSKEDMIHYFPGIDQPGPDGVTQLKRIAPDNVPKSAITEEERKALEGKYTVWEIWDKTGNQVLFISPTAATPLRVEPPFLDLEDFWPCPKPLWSTTTTDSLIPIPDYKYYQDQAEEIDDLTRRIASMTDSLKVVGFYPKGSEATFEIEKALNPGVENKMIGVEAWAAFSERGGVQSIQFLPLKDVIGTIQACVELRKQLIQDVYEITGLSDIMRGATNPHETLGAQQLKQQNGSIRVRDRQREIQRFARDIIQIIAEIVAEKFSPKTILMMTNQITAETTADANAQELQAQALQLLKNEQLRNYRVDVETDSTIQPDENAEKQRRTEFAQALGQLFQGAVPLAAQLPQLVPLIGETIRFVMRGFRVGRELEDQLDKTIGMLEQDTQQKMQAAQNAPPQPTKEQLDQKRIDQIETPKSQAEITLIQAQAAKTNAEAHAIPAKHALEQDKVFFKAAGDHADRAIEMEHKAQDRQDAQMQAATDQANVDTERQDQLAQADQEQANLQQQRGDQLAQQSVENDQAQQSMQMKANGQPNGQGTPANGSPASRPPAAGPQAPPQPPAGSIAALLTALAQSTAQNSQAIQQLAMVMATPTVVETPRGTYTARKMLQ